MQVASEVARLLTKQNQPYKSPFSEGMEAAADYVSWARCPYTEPNQQYERDEWLRGYQAAEIYR